MQVAIKIIDTRKLTTSYASKNLYREAKILAQIRHPNIVRIYETLKVVYALYVIASSSESLVIFLTCEWTEKLENSNFITKNYSLAIPVMVASIETTHHRVAKIYNQWQGLLIHNHKRGRIISLLLKIEGPGAVQIQFHIFDKVRWFFSLWFPFNRQKYLFFVGFSEGFW